MSTRRIDHWIGGKRVPSRSGRSGVVYDPATGEVQAEVGLASVEEVDDAVATAAEAFLASLVTRPPQRSPTTDQVRRRAAAQQVRAAAAFAT